MNPNDQQRPVQPWQPGQAPEQPAAPAPMPYQQQPPQPAQPYQPPTTPQAAPSQPQFFQPTAPAAPGARQPDADFSFITNPDKPAAKLNPLAGGSTLQRALFAVGGLAVLVIIGVVAASFIGGSGPNKLELMTTVAQQQTEVSRVAKLGATGATTNIMRGAALSVQLSSLSARGEVSSYLATNKEKLNPKLLGLKQSAKSDSSLKEAAANNTYNATFAEVMTTDLNNYMTSLKTAYDADPGPKGQELLKAKYTEAQLLSKQIADAANTSIDG